MTWTPSEPDCVTYKHDVQSRIYEEIQDLSPAEEVAYFEQAAEAGPLSEWWRAAKRAHAARAIGAAR
jgi:hypothetical protein